MTVTFPTHMPKHQILTSNAPAPGGAYSQALRVGEFVYTAGMGPWGTSTKQVVGETIEEQTVHLSDLSLFPRFNEAYARFFPDPKPVRTTVGSDLLGILVEIDVVAYAGD